MHTEFLNSITDIDPLAWDSLWPADYPFTRHAFLQALESSKSTTRKSGWQPCHMLVRDGDVVQAALVLFEKSHSYGEYVFDWGWADAYERAGMSYYPKLLSAIPFTPATGPRLGFNIRSTSEQRRDLTAVMHDAVRKRLSLIAGSGFHCLFPDARNRLLLAASGCVERQGCQFHWFNRDYTDFDGFLSSFSSRKRKNIRRERSKVAEQHIVMQMRSAAALSDSEWQQFALLYQNTYLKRSGHTGYLNIDFFLAVARAMPEQVLLCSAHRRSTDTDMLAAALYFRDNTTLYGRYWGAREEVDGLHFEACYYQGIDYAIKHGLQRFDPGAQGEHKIQRGFTPVKTCSYHWLQHPGFFAAAREFVDQESVFNNSYCEDGRRYLPFREGERLVDDSVLLTEA